MWFVKKFYHAFRQGWRPRRAAQLYCCGQTAELAVISTKAATSEPPALSYELQIVARSHAGRVRPNNEDSIAFQARPRQVSFNSQSGNSQSGQLPGQQKELGGKPDRHQGSDRQSGHAGIAVLADGMGGLNAGEVASHNAVDLVLRGLDSGQPMQQVVEDANKTIFELSRSDPELHNMGTTLVALQLVGDQMWLANVGDSRVYRYRATTLSQLTHDHSVVQQLVDSGMMTPEEALTAPNRNIITRALGIEESVEVEVLQDRPADGDLYMLCSDGVTDMLEPQALAELFVQHSSSAALVDAIVDAANAAGGVDNISVILVEVKKIEP